LDSLVEEAAGRNADGGVHAGSVGPGGENHDDAVVPGFLGGRDAGQGLHQVKGVAEAPPPQAQGLGVIPVLDLHAHGPALFHHLRKRSLDDGIADQAHHVTVDHVGLLHQDVHGRHSQASGEDAVESRGGASPLHMPQNRHSNVDAQAVHQELADFVGIDEQAVGMPGSLGHDDHLVGSADFPGVVQGRHHLLVPSQLELLLGDQHPGCPAGQGRRQGQVTAVASHGFKDEGALMGRRRGTQIVHGMHDVVEGRVGPDGHVRAVKIIVDGTRQADHLQGTHLAGRIRPPQALQVFGPFPGQHVSPRKGSVASDHHQGLDPSFQQVKGCLSPAFRGPELIRAGRSQERASLLKDSPHVLPLEGNHLVRPRHQAFIPEIDAVDLKAVVQCPAHHGPHRGIHARGIPSARHDCECFHHGNPPHDPFEFLQSRILDGPGLTGGGSGMLSVGIRRIGYSGIGREPTTPASLDGLQYVSKDPVSQPLIV